MSETVTVEITMTERLRYSTTVTMTRAEFDELEDTLEDGDAIETRRAEERIAECCDRKDDVVDSEDIEIEEFRVIEGATPNA